MMWKSLRYYLIFWTVALTACATPGQFLDSMQMSALDTAVTRGRFEMNCPEATGSVLSRKVVEPVVGPALGGVERAEYTIGVAGCGTRQVYVVLCTSDGEGCFAAAGTDGRGRR